jgi:hypothetical protein
MDRKYYLYTAIKWLLDQHHATFATCEDYEGFIYDLATILEV